MKKTFLVLAASLVLGASAMTAVSPSTNTVQAASTKKATTQKQTAAQQAKMRTFVRQTLNDNHVRGTTVVVKNGVPQQISYGYAWYGNNMGNGDPEITYPACSLQKVITAAIITQLINEKVGSSDHFSQYTTINRWYPDLKNSSLVTVGDLLANTSGNTVGNTEVDRDQDYTEQEAIDWIINDINDSPSGQIGSYFYNNANYILLAGIISKLTGKSYEQNFEDRIVNKLGLKGTYLYQDIPTGMTDPISYNYDYQTGKNYQNAVYVPSTLASQIPGAGNMFTTPMDYYKIQVALTDGTILDKDDFNYMTHVKSRVNNYAAGTYLDNNDNIKSAYGNLRGTHFGNWYQLTTDNKNGLIMFLNQTDDNEKDVKAVGYDILQHIKPNTFVAN